MKLRVVIDMEVSRTIAETIERNGFHLCPDGSAMQVRIPHTPSISRRKTKVAFLRDFDNQTVDKPV